MYTHLTKRQPTATAAAETGIMLDGDLIDRWAVERGALSLQRQIMGHSGGDVADDYA